MRILATLLLAFLGLVYCEDVIDLTDSTFKSGVAGEEIMLIEFFAPWCGHCKRLAPEYETAAKKLLKSDPPVKLAKVDCVGEGKDTCSQYGVSGYPTLKIFRNGEFSQEYDGPRDAKGIVAYMKKNSGPSSTLLASVEKLKKKIADLDTILIAGFFSSESDLYKNFMKAADSKRAEFTFVHSLDTSINGKFSHSDEIVLFRAKKVISKSEQAEEVLKSAASVSDIVSFIEEKEFGLVGHMTQDNEKRFSKPLVVVYYNVDWTRDAKGSRYWRNRVVRVAKKFSDIQFAIASTGDFRQQLSDMLFDDTEPGAKAVAAFDSKGSKFKMAEIFSVDSLETFTKDFKAGGLKPFIKSEPVPADNNGPVKVVVGENFDEIVNDPTKDVLIEFYAPWCGHCKSLEPKYTELGEKMTQNEHIVIAKMDATANDVPPPFQVSGFPTIFFASAKNKQDPQKYQGEREVADFVKFLEKESTQPIKTEKKKEL